MRRLTSFSGEARTTILGLQKSLRSSTYCTELCTRKQTESGVVFGHVGRGSFCIPETGYDSLPPVARRAFTVQVGSRVVNISSGVRSQGRCVVVLRFEYTHHDVERRKPRRVARVPAFPFRIDLASNPGVDHDQ